MGTAQVGCEVTTLNRGQLSPPPCLPCVMDVVPSTEQCLSSLLACSGLQGFEKSALAVAGVQWHSTDLVRHLQVGHCASTLVGRLLGPLLLMVFDFPRFVMQGVSTTLRWLTELGNSVSCN